MEKKMRLIMALAIASLLMACTTVAKVEPTAKVDDRPVVHTHTGPVVHTRTGCSPTGGLNDWQRSNKCR